MSIAQVLTYLLVAILLAVAIVFIHYTVGNARLMRKSVGHGLMAGGAISLTIATIISGSFFTGFYADTFAHSTILAAWAIGFLLVVAGGTLNINAIRKFYKKLSEVFMLKIMRLFIIGMAALILSFPMFFWGISEIAVDWYGWYVTSSLGLQIFALSCLVIAEKKYYASFKLTPQLEKREMQLPRGGVRKLEAYLNFTRGLITRTSQAIDTTSVKDILDKCAEEHPILLANYKKNAEILNSEVLAKNLNQIHETERDQELTRAFTCINSGLIDLFAAMISPARATEIVVSAVEAEMDNLTFWSAGVPLSKYNEIVYEREFIMRLPEGVAEQEKLQACTYLLFKHALEPLLKECKRSTIRKIKDYLESEEPTKTKVKIAEDGTLDLSLLYDYLVGRKFEVGVRESLAVFSSMLKNFYPDIKEDIGIKRANMILSKALTELLSKNCDFLQQYGIMEILPKSVEVPSEYRLPIFGKSYLIESKSPDRAFKIFSDMIRRGSYGLCISTLPPAEVKKKYDFTNRADVFWLSKVEVGYSISPSNLGMLRDEILPAMAKAKKSVVLLEGLEYLATTNGFDLTLKLLHDIREAAVVYQSVLIIPIAPKAFDTKNLELLERYMEVIGEKEEKND